MSPSSRPWIAAAWALLLWAAPAVADVGPDGSLHSPSPSVHSPSHATGWALLAAGLVLDASSFLLAERADESYQEYQQGIDPQALDHAYHRAVTEDRWASATLIAGQVGIATGLYLLLFKKSQTSDLGEAAPAREGRLSLGCRAGPGPRGLLLTQRF